MNSQNKPYSPKQLIKKLILKEGTAADQAFEHELAVLKREIVDKPCIYIIGGSSGMIAGANRIKEEVINYTQSHQLDADIVEVGSIGFTTAEPLMDVQLPGKCRISFANMQPENINIILDSILNNVALAEHALFQYKSVTLEDWIDVPNMHELPFFSHQNRLVLDNCGMLNPESINEYIARGGYKAFLKALYNYPENEVISILEKSQLRGRGGGGYPTFKKIKKAAEAAADQKYVICNADESDPGAFMDRALLEGDPHRIVEGTALAAYATGASIAYIYLRSEYEIATQRITKAVADAKEAGLLGYNIYDSGFNLEIFVKKGAGAFVCGEETALINSLEGKRGMPRPRPPYPAEKGLYGKPTVVSNIETIANIPAILDKGPSWFASIGTETSKGTKVFALSGDTVNKGLIEVSMGTTIHDIVYKMGGGISHERKIKAVQIGGPTGTCMPEENINTPIDYEALDNIGAIMGSGGLVVMDENKCMVEVARYFMDFIHKESCGKCIPCREGSGRMLEILEGITKRPDKESKYETLERFKGVTQIESLAEVIMQTSLCGLGKTAPNPLISTLKWFREEYEEHIFERNCKAGLCKGLKKYYINPEKCVGCGACFKKCPVDAIIGTLKQPHFVIEDKCIGCGLCFEACKFNAIYVK